MSETEPSTQEGPRRGPRPIRRELVPLFDELRGDRVVLRRHTIADVDELHKAIEESKDELRPWLPFADQERDDTLAFLTRTEAQWILRETLSCAIRDRETERIVGNIGLMIHDWEAGRFEIGYWLRTSATGKGYMTEAVRLITDFAFDHLWANRVEIRCDARNDRSAGVPRRLGFTQEARLRWSETLVGDILRDTLIFAMIGSDKRWPER